MSNKYIYSVIFVLTFFGAFSQGKIQIKLLNTGNFLYEKAYLFSFSGANKNIVDSAKFNAELSTSFTIKESNYAGVYELRFSGFEFLYFVFTPQVDNLSFSIDIAELKKGNWPKINEENEAFNEYYKLFHDFKFKSLANIKMRARLNKKDTTYFYTLKTYIAKINQLRTYLSFKLDSLNRIFPNTYVTKILSKIVKEPTIPSTDNMIQQDSDMVFMRKHFFDFWDFNEPNLFNNPFANERMMFYLSKYSGNSIEDKYEIIDILMKVSSKAAINKDIVFQFLLQYYIRFGPTEAATYLFDKYSGGCETVDLNGNDAKLIAEMKTISVGSFIPDFSETDINKNIIKFSEIYKKNKITLLIFWASNCQHCKEELPELKNIYAAFKKDGFEIVAFSLDTDENLWKKGMEEYSKDFINVTDFKGFKSDLLKRYFIYRTPASFLVGQNGIILRKNSNPHEIEKYLKEKLR